MKNIVAAFLLSVGLFSLFADNAQAQRARWSGNARNSGYEFNFNLDVTDKDDVTESGLYLQTVNYFRYQNPNNPNENIFSSGLGKLILNKYDLDADLIDDTIGITIEFDDNSPIKSSLLMINPDNSNGTDVNFNNINLDNLSVFYDQLSKINLLVDEVNSYISFQNGTRDTYQREKPRLEIERDSSVSVPEPNLGYSWFFMLPIIAMYLRRRKRSERAKTMLNLTINS